MNMNLGAEPKKVAMLGGLVVVLLAVWLYNSSQTPDYGAPSSTPVKAPKEVGSLPASAPPPPPARRDAPTAPRRAGSRQQLRSTMQDFKPKLFDKENPVDPTKVDPTLVTQTLAKLQAVTLSGGSRSLFDFGAAAAPAVDVPKGPIIKPKPKPKGNYPFYGPVKPVDKPVTAEVKAPPPPPPPIPLKFYGFVTSKRDGSKRAFFMEGEEIYIAGEGDLMKKRYKVVKIGVNSVTVEDTQHKSQQALPLVEEQPSGSD